MTLSVWAERPVALSVCSTMMRWRSVAVEVLEVLVGRSEVRLEIFGLGSVGGTFEVVGIKMIAKIM